MSGDSNYCKANSQNYTDIDRASKCVTGNENLKNNWDPN
jgi:hypothetical protein